MRVIKKKKWDFRKKKKKGKINFFPQTYARHCLELELDFLIFHFKKSSASM